MEPSPDGKYVALWSQGRASRQFHSSFVHIVNTGTGDVRPVPDRREVKIAALEARIAELETKHGETVRRLA
jgi:hypothetical protein